MEMMPFFARGAVVHGFGRGSRQLGIPTANLPDDVVSAVPSDLKCGVYFGWASLRRQSKLLANGSDDEKLRACTEITVYPAVASIGMNPFFKNTKRSLEVHILKIFEEDFYGEELRVCLCGWIREQRNFRSTEELIDAIESDIRLAKEKLQEPYFERLRSHSFFVGDNPPSVPFYDDGSNNNYNNTTSQQLIELNNSAEPIDVASPCDHCGCARVDD